MGEALMFRIVVLCSLVVAIVVATPGWGGDCDLHITGIGGAAKTNWSLDGLYINCGSQSGGPGGFTTNYCLSIGDQDYLVQMQYCEAGSYACSGIKNWTSPGWAITGFNASSGA